MNLEDIRKIYPVVKVKLKSVPRGFEHDKKVRYAVLKEIREGITIRMASDKFGIKMKTISNWVYVQQHIRKNHLKINRI
jgi:hypothetical protein